MFLNTYSVAADDPHPPATKKLPAFELSKEKITLLVITHYGDDCQYLRSILGGQNCSIQRASSIREATRLLHESEPHLILCEKALPDGSWIDVFREAGGKQDPPPVVVVSRNADERLWAEVLNLGGYDMLLKPFDESEVLRVISMAARHAKRTLRSVAAVA